MRRFWVSTEFWGSIGVCVMLCLFSKNVPIEKILLAASVLVDSYILGRTLWKKNRGQFYSAVKSSEFHMIVALHLFTFLAWKYWGLAPLYAMAAVTINQTIYNILRGITKGLGVKTQMIFG